MAVGLERVALASRAPRTDLRLATIGAALVLAALVVTTVAPLWLIGLAPIALGVPHVLADVRYLVVRPGFHLRIALWITVLGGSIAAALGLGLAGGLLGAAGAIAFARAEKWKRAVGVVIAIALAAIAFRARYRADILFAHLHNVVAVGFFVAWRRRDVRANVLLVAVAVLGTALLLSGAADAALLRASIPGNKLDWPTLVHALAPVADARLGMRLVATYAFLQCVHYVVWLHFVPRESPRADRTLRRDLTWWILGPSIAVAVVIAAWATRDLAAARAGYLKLAFAHGFIELAAGAVLLVEGRRLADP